MSKPRQPFSSPNVEMVGFGQLDRFRSRGVGSGEETGDWMHAFSEILLTPPGVEILRVSG